MKPFAPPPAISARYEPVNHAAHRRIVSTRSSRSPVKHWFKFGVLAVFAVLASFSLRAQNDPDNFLYSFISGDPADPLTGPKTVFEYKFYCIDGHSGLFLDCLFEDTIEFDYPAVVNTPAARLLWGGGHLHTGNRPLGKVESGLGYTDRNGTHLLGETGHRGWQIRETMPMMIPGEVTNHARAEIKDQPDPTNPSGPNLRWRIINGSTWHPDPGNPSNKGKYNYAVYAEYPIQLLTIFQSKDVWYSNPQSPNSVHPEVYWGTLGTDVGVRELSQAYMAIFRFSHPDEGLAGMMMDRVALPNGGYFDLDYSWSDQITFHYNGRSVDFSGVSTDLHGVVPLDSETMDIITRPDNNNVSQLETYRLNTPDHLNHFVFKN